MKGVIFDVFKPTLEIELLYSLTSLTRAMQQSATVSQESAAFMADAINVTSTKGVPHFRETKVS